MSSLVERRVVRSPRIADAMRAVPRHLFVPSAPLAAVYSDATIDVLDSSGAVATVASQPTAIAWTLEGLDPQPGWRILDVGTGTGYLAALLGHLVGPAGSVDSVELPGGLVAEANARFASLGMSHVTAQIHDGSVELPGQWDAIVVGAAVARIPEWWIRQLAPQGRLLAPMALSSPVQAMMVFRREANWLRGETLCNAQYVPLLGPFGPLQPEAVAPALFIQSDHALEDWTRAAALPMTRLPLPDLPVRHLVSFLHWLTVCSERYLMIEGESDLPWADRLGYSRNARWSGIGRSAAIAVLGKRTSEPEGPNDPRQFDVNSFGDPDLAAYVVDEFNRFLAHGAPNPGQLHVDIGPRGAAPPGEGYVCVVDREWGRLAVRIEGSTP